MAQLTDHLLTCYHQVLVIGPHSHYTTGVAFKMLEENMCCKGSVLQYSTAYQIGFPGKKNRKYGLSMLYMDNMQMPMLNLGILQDIWVWRVAWKVHDTYNKQLLLFYLPSFWLLYETLRWILWTYKLVEWASTHVFNHVISGIIEDHVAVCCDLIMFQKINEQQWLCMTLVTSKLWIYLVNIWLYCILSSKCS